MLDESMFEDIHEIAENSAYLKAVEEKDVSLEMYEQLPSYDNTQVHELEDKLRAENKLTFDSIFNEAIGYYYIKCFLIADYAVDKACFIKDVESYRKMRFESARRKVAKLIYQRFVSTDSSPNNPLGPNGAFADTASKKGLSVFQIIQLQKQHQAQSTTNNVAAGGGLHAAGLSGDNKNMLEPSHAITRTAGGHGGSQIAALHDRNFSNNGAERSTIGGNALVSQNGHPSISNNMQSPATHTHQHSVISPNSVHTDMSFKKEQSLLQMGTANNTIGVYGSAVRSVKQKVETGSAPADLFDVIAREVMNDLKLDAFPRFLQSDFYRKYMRTKFIECVKVSVRDFTTFRVLGRGGFGAVHACRKKNSGTIYAMKAINKKLVKVKSALENVLEERNVLTMMNSNFVTNLKYALQDDESLYLIMDLMLGGDLKFHLINAGRFTEKRARFYAAQVLLGLEQLHEKNIVYRDMKLENVLLDHNGNCRISDLGLAVVTKVKIKGYAGTPGYTAPEMIKNKLYGFSADIFSYGVMLYRMLCGSKPFKGKVDRDLDKAVLEKKPQFPKEIFSKEAMSLLTGLLQKRPENRLGCGERGLDEVKEHPFFESIDWGLLEAGYIDPPFVPNKYDVNAASLKDIGDFDRAKYRHVKLDDRFRARVKNFEFISTRALQDEMVAVLEKADENVNFEKFAQKQQQTVQAPPTQSGACCSIV